MLNVEYLVFNVWCLVFNIELRFHASRAIENMSDPGRVVFEVVPR